MRSCRTIVWMRRTPCKLAHEQLGLVGIQGLKSHGRRKIIVIRAIPHQEKIAASFRRHETCCAALVPGWETHKGLPGGTKMMFTGIYRNIEIGIAVGGSDPGAVQAKARRRPRAGGKIRVILQEINQRLTGFGFQERMFGFCGLHVELGAVFSAAGSGGLLQVRGLRDRGNGEKEQHKERAEQFHGF